MVKIKSDEIEVKKLSQKVINTAAIKPKDDLNRNDQISSDVEWSISSDNDLWTLCHEPIVEISEEASFSLTDYNKMSIKDLLSDYTTEEIQYNTRYRNKKLKRKNTYTPVIIYTAAIKKKQRMEHICEICGKLTRNLKNHRAAHREKLKEPVKCDICGKSYSTKSTLRKHKLLHDEYKRFPCNICEMRFSLRSYLVKHERVHTGERNYKCDICKKSFQTNYNLKTHIRVHTRETPFKCNNCEMEFSHRATYNIHVRNCNLYIE